MASEDRSPSAEPHAKPPQPGSGTTGEAALREGRHFVGVELSDHYAEMAEAQLAGAERDLTQSDFVLAPPPSG